MVHTSVLRMAALSTKRHSPLSAFSPLNRHRHFAYDGAAQVKIETNTHWRLLAAVDESCLGCCVCEVIGASIHRMDCHALPSFLGSSRTVSKSPSGCTEDGQKTANRQTDSRQQDQQAAVHQPLRLSARWVCRRL